MRRRVDVSMRSICHFGALRPWGISGRGSLVVFYREVRMRPCKDRRRYAAMWPYVMRVGREELPGLSYL